MMNVSYTEYAENTIKDRIISKKMIEEAFKKPDEIVKGKKGRKIIHKLIKDKLLRIVYEPQASTYLVITAYYAKPGRYMKP